LPPPNHPRRADEVIEYGSYSLQLLTTAYGTDRRSLSAQFTAGIEGTADLK